MAMQINDPMDLDDEFYSAGVGQLNIPVAERKILKPRRRQVELKLDFCLYSSPVHV